MPWVVKSVRSLQAQTVGEFTLIVSDNASTDGTSEALEKIAGEDDRVRYSRNETNIGGEANFNRVLALAETEFFVWAGADDLWEPRFLEVTLGALRAEPDAVLAFGGCDLINMSGIVLDDYPCLRRLNGLPLDRQVREFLTQPGGFGKANLVYGLMRLDVLVASGGMRNRSGINHADDVLLLLDILMRGRCVVSEEILFHKRARPRPQEAHLIHPAREAAFWRAAGVILTGHDAQMTEYAHRMEAAYS